MDESYHRSSRIRAKTCKRSCHRHCAKDLEKVSWEVTQLTFYGLSTLFLYYMKELFMKQ